MSRGDGSVYRRADGKWVGAFVLPNGRRIYRYAKTQRDVREKLRRLRIAWSRVGQLRTTAALSPST